MDQAQVRRLVIEWHQRSKRERDPTSKFIFLWFCFNAWLAFESEEDTDRQMINWIKGAVGARSRLRSSFQAASASTTFQRHLDGLIALSPIEATGRRNNPPARVTSREDFGAVVEAIYRIRCNLFHGGKRPGDVRDKKLITVASRILEKWIGNLVATWRS